MTTRGSTFEELDKPALKPLPALPYTYAEWKTVRPGSDYHIEVNRYYFSVPYQLVGRKMDARITQNTIEVFYKGKRVASHMYNPALRFTTLPEHMPEPHKKNAEWTPQRIIDWAKKTGNSTASTVELIMESRMHPQQGFRSCIGIISLGKSYTQERLEAACSRSKGPMLSFTYISHLTFLRVLLPLFF